MGVEGTRVREENGRLFAGTPERAYKVSTTWSEQITVRKFRYVDDYDRNPPGFKRYIVARMSFEKDDVCILGDSKRLNARNEAAITITPTPDMWIPSAVEKYDWTLHVDWFEELIGALSLPVGVFDSIAAKVLAGQVDSLWVLIRGGFWVDEKREDVPDRYSRVLYLRPSTDGRSEPDSATCRVEGLRVECGRPRDSTV